MSDDLVSVLLVVKNGASTLTETLSSIASQTYSRIEIVFVDDGSQDDSSQIFLNHEVSRKYAYVHLVNKPSIGLTRSLNIGLRECTGKYLARIDHDDQWQSTKLKSQVDLMCSEPNIVIVGTGYDEYYLKDCRVRPSRYIVPESDSEIREAMYERNPFLHSSVLVSIESLRSVGGYNESFVVAQDYELWGRLLLLGSGHNLQDVLVRRFVGPSNISVKKERMQRLNAMRSRIRWGKYNGFKSKLFLAVFRDLVVIVCPSFLKALIRSRF